MTRAFCKDHPDLYGITAEEIAELLGVHVTTARRYKRGESPSQAQLELLRLKTKGDLSILSGEWQDWRLCRGKLIAPDGAQYGPGEVLSTTYWRALAKHYQVRQRLPEQADWVEGEWVTHEVQSDSA